MQEFLINEPLKGSGVMTEKRGQGYAVKFNATNVLGADSGQTVVPFFDAAPVVSDPPSALGGVGIFYKSTDSEDFAGLISIKLLSVDYPKYMQKSVEDLDNLMDIRVDKFPIDK